jgi:hypothetical protein
VVESLGNAGASLRLSGPSRAERRFARQATIGSDVVIEMELVGVRAQAHSVVFALLHLDEIVDEVLGEDIALEQELVVGLERLERTL